MIAPKNFITAVEMRERFRDACEKNYAAIKYEIALGLPKSIDDGVQPDWPAFRRLMADDGGFTPEMRKSRLYHGLEPSQAAHARALTLFPTYYHAAFDRWLRQLGRPWLYEPKKKEGDNRLYSRPSQPYQVAPLILDLHPSDSDLRPKYAMLEKRTLRLDLAEWLEMRKYVEAGVLNLRKLGRGIRPAEYTMEFEAEIEHATLFADSDGATLVFPEEIVPDDAELGRMCMPWMCSGEKDKKIGAGDYNEVGNGESDIGSPLLQQDALANFPQDEKSYRPTRQAFAHVICRQRKGKYADFIQDCFPNGFGKRPSWKSKIMPRYNEYSELEPVSPDTVRSGCIATWDRLMAFDLANKQNN